MSKFSKALREFCAEYEYEFYKNYSGRGMFGKKCIGFACETFTNAILELQSFCSDSEGIKQLPLSCIDRLGLGYIVYFPYEAE